MNLISVNPMAVATLPLPQQIELLRAVGADQFGLTVSACKDAGWEAALELLGGRGASLGYLCHGVTASADDADSWRAETALLREAVDFASRAGAQQIYFTTGHQGRALWEDAAQQVVEHLAPLVDYARAAGVLIALENTLSLRSEISFTHSVRDAALLASMTGAHLCVDLYCCWGEAGLEGTLWKNLGRIAMVQISDMKVGDLQQPNRRVPGDGDVPLKELLDLLKRLGYDGVVDVELLGPQIERQGPQLALERGLRWLEEVWRQESR